MPRKRSRSNSVLPMTPKPTLTNLLNLHRRTKRKSSEVAGEMREAISNAVDNKHLHRGAFNTIKRMFLLPDEKLAEELTFLLAYLDLSGINDRVEKVGRLPLGDDVDTSNVVRLPAEAAAE